MGCHEMLVWLFLSGCLGSLFILSPDADRRRGDGEPAQDDGGADQPLVRVPGSAREESRIGCEDAMAKWQYIYIHIKHWCQKLFERDPRFRSKGPTGLQDETGRTRHTSSQVCNDLPTFPPDAPLCLVPTCCRKKIQKLGMRRCR